MGSVEGMIISRRLIQLDSFTMSSSKSKKDWLRAARASGHYPLSYNFVFERQDRNVQCSYCGRFVNEKKITRDHVWPKSLKGYLKVPACIDCNIKKEDLKPIEWAVLATSTGIALLSDVSTD